MMTITTYVDIISTGAVRVHELEEDRLNAMRDYLLSGNNLPRPLVVEDIGNGSYILDGHHRIALEEETIEVNVISSDDFEALIAEEFGGEVPERLCDLDEYIEIDGSRYER